MAQPQQSNQNDAGSRRPFSFQIPPDAPQTHTPTPISTSQAQHAQGTRSEWAGYPAQRFSYVETPIDENTQTFDDERQAALFEEARRRYGELSPETPSQAPTPQQQSHSQQKPATAHPAAGFPAEKQELDRVPSAYQQQPPAQQHPAFSAPVASDVPETPQSPGPLPLKDEHDFPATAHVPPQRFSVVPDGQPPTFQGPPGSHFSTFSADAPYAANIHATAGTSAPSHQFHHGLCACPGSDMSTCCVGLFCPCILYSRLQYRLGRRSKRADPTELLGWHKCDSSCIGFGALSLCCLCGILAGFARGRVRRAYNIDGGTSSDCIEGCCCCCCTVIQGERELRVREEERVKATGARGALDAYQRQSGMTYQPGGQ